MTINPPRLWMEAMGGKKRLQMRKGEEQKGVMKATMTNIICKDNSGSIYRLFPFSSFLIKPAD